MEGFWGSGVEWSMAIPVEELWMRCLSPVTSWMAALVSEMKNKRHLMVAQMCLELCDEKTGVGG
jgi:hypothetical protein